VIHFDVDILGGSLAEVDLMVHLPAHMVHIVVDHGEGDRYGKDRDDAEGNGRIGHEFIGLYAAVGFHCEEL